MASALAILREAVYQAVVDKKAAAGFVLNEFVVEWAYLPHKRLQDVPTGGQVWVLGMASDDVPNKSRTNLCLKEIPIQIALQCVVDPTDKTTIDQLVELEEQLRDVCRKDVDAAQFNWLRTESLKDENGTPYSFMGMREASIFEAYFTAYYQTILA